LFDSGTASLVPSKDVPDAPKPMIELTKNFEPNPPSPSARTNEDQSTDKADEQPLYKPATEEPNKKSPTAELVPVKEVQQPAEVVAPPVEPENPKPLNDGNNSDVPQRSLFERFFKDRTE